jgi:hypothetical protein
MVGPGRNWLPPTKQKWHSVTDMVIQDQSRTEVIKNSDQGKCCKRNLKRTDILEKTMDMPRKQQCNIRPRLKEATMFKEGKDIWQDLQEDHRAGDCKATS